MTPEEPTKPTLPPTQDPATPTQAGVHWGSKLGVILAVAGSAVGLGNFLRFPGQAAKYGGGAFMIPYFVAFLVVGIPICWAEWIMGRHGGRYGMNSAPGIFATLWRRPWAKYFGVLGLLIPVTIYMFYVYLESWCLFYTYSYAVGDLELGANPAAYSNFFASQTGTAEADGAVFAQLKPVLWFFVVTFALNFALVYRGLRGGIETFCKIAMPILIVAAIGVAVFVVTLPEQPIALPWQRGLARALPAERWDELRGLAVAEGATAERTKAAVADAFAEYFDANQAATNLDGLTSRLEEQVEDLIEDRGEIATLPAYLRPLVTAELERRGVAAKSAEAAALDDEIAEAVTAQAVAYLDKFDATAPVAPPAGIFDTLPAYAAAMAELRRPRDYGDWLVAQRSKLPTDVKFGLQRLEQRQEAADADVAAIATERAALWPLDSTRSFADDLAAIPLGDGTTVGAGAAELQHRLAALEASELPRTVYNGLGYMWNPDLSALLDPEVWLAAAGQIFFSLSVGFGIILSYASYLRRNDDVVLSGLTAASTNEFCEVVLGGLIALPATFMFLGTVQTLAVVDGASTVGLGFNSLPAVFAGMPGGRWVGMVWFGLLFLAGITSSLSMLQPAIAFLEDGFGVRRRASVLGLGLLTLLGGSVVIWFSSGAVAIDTIDFWVGSVMIFVLATIEVLVFAYVFGVDRGVAEAMEGAEMKLPALFRPMILYVTPTFLLVVFTAFLIQSLPKFLPAIAESRPTQATLAMIAAVALLCVAGVFLAGRRWQREGRGSYETATEGTTA